MDLDMWNENGQPQGASVFTKLQNITKNVNNTELELAKPFGSGKFIEFMVQSDISVLDLHLK